MCVCVGRGGGGGVRGSRGVPLFGGNFHAFPT